MTTRLEEFEQDVKDELVRRTGVSKIKVNASTFLLYDILVEYHKGVYTIDVYSAIRLDGRYTEAMDYAVKTIKLNEAKVHGKLSNPVRVTMTRSTFRKLQRTRNPYFLDVSEKYPTYDYKTGKELPPSYNGRSDLIRLTFPSIEAVHEVAKLAGLDSYKILSGADYDKARWGNGETVFKTPDILDYEHTMKREEEEGKYKRAERIESIGKTPRVVVLRRYSSSVVYAYRNKPAMFHGKLSMSPRIVLKIKGRRGDITLPDTIHSLNQKKFMNEHAWMYPGGRSPERAVPARYSRYLGKTTEGRPAVKAIYHPDLVKLMEDLPEIIREFRDLVSTKWSTVVNPMRRTHKRRH